MLFSRIVGATAALVSLLPCVLSTPVPKYHTAADLRRTPTTSLNISNPQATNVIPNSYIVVYKPTTSNDEMKQHLSYVNHALSKRDSNANGVGTTYNFNNFKGYHIQANKSLVATILKMAEV